MKEFSLSKFILLQAVALLFVFITGCASSSSDVIPAWVYDTDQDFPKSEFLIQTATGTSAAEAKSNAMAELASFFNTSIQRTINSQSLNVQTSDGNTFQERAALSTVITKTDLDVFGMETTESYFYKNDKKWYCAAYINRDTAWNQFEPTVTGHKNSFLSVYNLTFENDDPIYRIKNLKKSEKTAELFISDLYKATMLSKTLTEKAFSDDRLKVDQIEGLIQKEKNRCFFYINVSNDDSNVVRAAINNAITSADFSVTDNAKNAFYTVSAKVEFNRQDEDDLIVLYPEVIINLDNSTDSIYVYNGKVEKVLSYVENKAKKNACQMISKHIQENLTQDFLKGIGLGE